LNKERRRRKMDGSVMKFVKLTVFDGEHKKFQVWWTTRFIMYAGVFGFSKALIKGGEAKLPATGETVIDETTDIGKLQTATVKRNAIACHSQLMAPHLSPYFSRLQFIVRKFLPN
jgi:hypothetical protein